MDEETFPKKVILNECWARDGLQNYPEFINTSDKVKMLHFLSNIGFERVEATSFSHPKYVPQFQDAEDVLKELPKKSKTSFKATCVNKRGLERAVNTVEKNVGPNEVSFVIAASETYNRINVRKKQKDLLSEINQMIKISKSYDIKTVVSVSTAFGYQQKGDVKSEDVYSLVEHFVNSEVDYITIGDTTGMGEPLQVSVLFKNLKKFFPETQFVAHFHDTKGWGMANAYAALQVGVDH